VSLVNTALYSGDLEVRINLLGNADEFPARLELSQTMRKILVAHSLFLHQQIIHLRGLVIPIHETSGLEVKGNLPEEAGWEFF
jgi:hypothetical protein